MQWLSIELVSIFICAGAVAGGLLALAFSLRRWRRAGERDTQRVFEQLDLMRGELLLLADRIEQLDVAPAKVIERPVMTEPRMPTPASHAAPRGYEVAARLAKGGATCEELISSCGLSRHEAELLLRLHRGDATHKATTKTEGQLKANEDRRARLSVVG